MTLTEDRGSLPLPLAGTAEAGLLDDGTPVVVVAHQDGTVSVIDVRVPAGTTRYGEDDGATTRHFTAWWGGAGRFLGGGVWDRFGRALDNGPHANLDRYEATVIGNRVQVGQMATVPWPGDPIIDEEPFGANVEPLLPPLISLANAVAAPVGTVVQIDATAVVRSDVGGRLCTFAGTRSVDLGPCPDDAPVIDDLSFASPDGRLWTSWFHGPIVARRTATGFAEVVSMGGRSGRAE